MNGGHEFFSSLFGEFLVGRDCSSVLQDPNAEPLDKEICSSLMHFQKQLGREPKAEKKDYRLEGSSCPDNPQALRDEILHRPVSRHSQPDRDLDGSGDEVWGRDWSRSSQPSRDHKHYSSSTTVIINQKPDGSYEEKIISRDSKGRETVTTKSTESDKNSFYKIFGSKKS